MINRTVAVVSAALLASSLASPVFAQSPPPQLSFHVADNFLKLPDNVYMAEVVGVRSQFATATSSSSIAVRGR